MQTSPIANPVTNRNIDDLEEEIISPGTAHEPGRVPLSGHGPRIRYPPGMAGPINLTTAPNGSI